MDRESDRPMVPTREQANVGAVHSVASGVGFP